MDKKRQNALELLTFVGILSAPIVTHNTVGQLPFHNYDAISGRIAKIQIDNENIKEIYGPDLAESFQSFFITGLILANIFLLVLCLLFLWQQKRGTLFGGFGRGLNISKEMNRKMLHRRLVYLGTRRPARTTRPRAISTSPAAGAIRFSLYPTVSTEAPAARRALHFARKRRMLNAHRRQRASPYA